MGKGQVCKPFRRRDPGLLSMYEAHTEANSVGEVIVTWKGPWEGKGRLRRCRNDMGKVWRGRGSLDLLGIGDCLTLKRLGSTLGSSAGTLKATVNSKVGLNRFAVHITLQSGGVLSLP